jgi:hypothetical protein
MADIEDYLAGKDAEAVALFRRFHDLAVSVGPDIEVAPSRTVVFYRKPGWFKVGPFVETTKWPE